MATTSVVFGTPKSLPRGPHSLAREEVAESQQIRLFAALTELMATQGYPSITITNLVEHAGVSRTTFYEHFANKQACLFAAYDRYIAFVMATLNLAFAEGDSWQTFVESTVTGYLELLTRDVTATRAFLVEMDAAGPEARRHRRDAWQSFADLIEERHRAVRVTEPHLELLPRRAYLAILLATRDLVVEALADEDTPDLTELAPDVVFFAEAIFQGAASARQRADTATAPPSS